MGKLERSTADKILIMTRALNFIPQEVHRDAIRLVDIVLCSGADIYTALGAVLRWTNGRELYGGLHDGLQEFFHSLTR